MKHWTLERVTLPALLVLFALTWGCQPTGSAHRANASDGDTHVVVNDGGGEPSPSAPPAHSGKAVFPESEFDFGEVEQGEKVSHVFKVRNEGQEVLHIKRVRGS